MSGSVNRLDVFISTPSDTAPMVETAKRIVDDLQDALLDRGTYIRLHHQKTIAPSVADEVQAAINPKLEACDLHIAILNARMGTPTKNHPSGTAEEVRRTLERKKVRPESVELMVYMKTQHDDLLKVDAEQLRRLQSFAEELTASGVHYQPFRGDEEFAKMLRKHLRDNVERWSGETWKQPVQVERDAKPSTALARLSFDAAGDVDEPEELGMFDLVIVAEDEMRNAVGYIGDMTEGMEGIGEKLAAHTENIQNTDVAKLDNKGRKKLIDAAADDISGFADKLSSDSGAFQLHFGESLAALEKAIELQAEFGDGQDARNEISDLQRELREMRQAIAGGMEGGRQFRATMASMPRLTTRFNRANRKAGKALDVLLSSFAAYQAKLDEIDVRITDLFSVSRPNVGTDDFIDTDAVEQSVPPPPA